MASISSIQFISCKTQQLVLADFGPLGLSGVVNLTICGMVLCWCVKIFLKLARLLFSALRGDSAQGLCPCL